MRLAFAAFIIFLLCHKTGEASTIDDNTDQINPTLFSLSNEEGELISATSNPLYKQLQQDSNFFLTSSPSQKDLMKLNRDEVSFDETLTLSWIGDDILDDDVLAFYCPASEPIHNHFREAMTVSQLRRLSSYENSQHHWEFRFPIMRENTCEFRLWKQIEPLQYILRAKTDVLHVRDAGTHPHGIHLSLGENQHSMRVHFTTGNKGIPMVRYRKLHSSHDPELGIGTSTTYKASDMCEAPANEEGPGKFIDPGMLHVVTMQHLDLDTEYRYRVGILPEGKTEEEVVWSRHYTFRSRPDPASKAPYSFVVYGDQGVDETPLVIQRIGGALSRRDHLVRAVHCIGDTSYAMGAGHVWDKWLHMMQPVAASIPLMVSIGNHDYDYENGGDHDPTSHDAYYHGPSSGGECGIPISKRFMPPHSNGNGIFWYAYDYEQVYFIHLSSEHDLSLGSTQRKWFHNQLLAVDRQKTPWVVVEMHRPIYNSHEEEGNHEQGIKLRGKIEDLFYRHKVNLVLTGHYHSYFRSCKGLYQSKCQGDGPMYITAGTAGAGIRDRDLFPEEQVFTDSTWNNGWGYGNLTVFNSSALLWQFIAHDDGLVKDEVWMWKNA